MPTLETLRQYNISGYAIFDLFFSFLGVYLLSPWLTAIFKKINLNIPKHNWLFLTLPASIVIHLLVGNYTQMTQDFLQPNGHFLLKAIIIGSFLAGIKDIKKLKY
jgi:hypothetical protein